MNNDNEPLVEVKDLKTQFVTWKGVVKALENITFEIYKGEVLGLVGETGCGKSVTSLSIMGLIPPDQGAIVEGKIIFNGIDITQNVTEAVKIVKKGRHSKIKVKVRKYKKHQKFLNNYRGKMMTMIFQEPMSSLNPVYDIGFQLAEPLLTHAKDKLALRILSRIKVDDHTFNEVVNAVINGNEFNSSDPLVMTLEEQVKDIWNRTDIMKHQKIELIEKLHHHKGRIMALQRRYLEKLTSGNVPFYYKIPYLDRYFMMPIKREAEVKASEMLAAVGIYNPEKIINSYPHELSGGMRQRVMIAMALLTDPVLLIADEPTTALDVTIQAQILDLIKNLRKRIKSSILFITHDLGVIADIADRVAVMYAGNIVEIGNTVDIFYNPKHPYTHGLINSIPTEKSTRGRLYVIPGSIPNMYNPPEGCRFAPRCPYKTEICEKEAPLMKEVEKGHFVACYHTIGDVDGK